MMQPVVDRLSDKVVDWADVYSVNIDRCPGLAGEYNISCVPTFVSFADGKAIDRKTGALTEGQLINLLNAAKQAMPADADDAQERDTLQMNPQQLRPYITIVSGLPRSGTSMMMRMLEAGGIPALTDKERIPDEDNPNGYYEFEDVKSIESYDQWIDQAPGSSVKMVYSLLKHLPIDREYRVVFMRRHTDEILQSQKKMLERNGIETDIPDDVMKMMFERKLNQFYAWLPSQTHLKLINVSYNELLANPQATIGQINHHFEDTLKAEAMQAMIDQNLYRHRAA